MHPFPEDDRIAYEPPPDNVSGAVITGFMRDLGVSRLEELHALVRRDPDTFWTAVLADLGWAWREPPHRLTDLTAGKPWAKFFPGATTNVVDNLFRLPDDAVALDWHGEDGDRRTFTTSAWRSFALRLAAGLRRAGIGQGDRVGLLMPMVPETAAVFVALAALGAVCVPIFSGYGVPAVVSRLNDSNARMLITADGFFRRRREIALLDVALESVRGAPSVTDIVVVPRLGRSLPAGVMPFSALMGDDEATVAAVAADHPLMLIYTSGTTGKPKGTVHTHAGFPVKAAQDLRHCFDLRRGETLFWLTDMGWMMGPWSILGSGIIGATNVMYEGTPDTPHPGRLWEICETSRVNVFGLSPTVIRSLMPHGGAPVAERDLSSLRVLGSSGEPWDPASWRWYFSQVGGGRLPVINYSGGTEISGGILGSHVTLPMKPCAFHGPVPGMSVEILDSAGSPVDGAGTGDLAIAEPWVGMTQGFWGDRDRYLETYWSKVPDVWLHGDAVMRDDDGFWYVLGRSDDTINTAGKRVSPAEAESAALSHPAVSEAAAIGVPDPVKGEVMVLFVTLGGIVPSEADVKEDIGRQLEWHLGKSLRPKAIHVVAELPHTRSGKIVRRAVRASFLGLPLGDVSTLENPSCLADFAGLSG